VKLRVLAPVAVTAAMVGYWLAGGAGFPSGTKVVVRLRNGTGIHGRIRVDGPLLVVARHPMLGLAWWLRWEIKSIRAVDHEAGECVGRACT
jgi:hypothetical protein